MYDDYDCDCANQSLLYFTIAEYDLRNVNVLFGDSGKDGNVTVRLIT